MEVEAIVTYVVCDDTIKFLGIKEDKQVKMSMSEIMTTAIISAIQFSGTIEKARRALKTASYFPNMLSKSQFNRRLLRIDKTIWQAVLEKLTYEFERMGLVKEFVVDSFPVPVCKMARKDRCKIYQGKEYLGYCAAKKEFFWGIKVHMISDVSGNPRQYLLLPAAISDIEGLRKINLSLPKNSGLYGDKAYNDYKYEERLVQEKQIHLQPIRKKNSTRKGSGLWAKIRQKKRKIIETTFSCIEKLMPRSIHAVTKAGFELKVTLFILAYGVTRLCF
jgi:hypothetical protein